MENCTCVKVDAKTFDWIYFWAGVGWFITGYFCAKCVVQGGEYYEHAKKLDAEGEVKEEDNNDTKDNNE
jgi:hypothetical protein